MGQGLGDGPFQEGLSEQYNEGTGGAGRGVGERPTDTEGDYDTDQEIVKRPPQEGPIIASWLFNDVQVEGETKRSLSDVIQAGRETAAEAISENQIPRKYEEPIKIYFNNVAERTGSSEEIEVEE